MFAWFHPESIRLINMALAENTTPPFTMKSLKVFNSCLKFFKLQFFKNKVLYSVHLTILGINNNFTFSQEYVLEQPQGKQLYHFGPYRFSEHPPTNYHFTTQVIGTDSLLKELVIA